MLEQIAQALRPEDRRGSQGIDEAVWIHVVTEFGKNICNMIQAAGSIHVSDKIDSGHLRGRYQDGSARRIEAVENAGTGKRGLHQLRPAGGKRRPPVEGRRT